MDFADNRYVEITAVVIQNKDPCFTQSGECEVCENISQTSPDYRIHDALSYHSVALALSSQVSNR